MEDNSIVLKVVADYKKAIKEWEELRDKVASTAAEYNEAQKAIKDLKTAMSELTGVYKKSAKELEEEKKANQDATKAHKERELAIKAALASQSSSTLAHKNSESSIQGEINRLKDLRATLDTASNQYTELGNRVSLLNQKLLSVKAGGANAMTSSMNQMKTATGSASSAAMELSRVVSDAPYGIRGMANNITQLVSQLGYAAKATDAVTGKTLGFDGAIKAMFKSFAGPLGIVFAITAVVSAIDYFFGAQTKAKEATDKTTQSIKKQITALEKLINLKLSLNGVFVEEADSTAMATYKNGLLSLDETVKVLTRNFSDFSSAYDKLTESQKKDPKAIKALVDGYQELLKAREQEQKQIERMVILRADLAKNGEKISTGGLTFIRAEKRELDTLEGSYIKTQKRLIELEAYFEKQKNPKEKKQSSSRTEKISPFKTGEELEIDIKSNESAILSYSNQLNVQNLKNKEAEELLNAKGEEDKKAIKKKYAESFLRLELDNELSSLKLRKDTEKLVMEAKYKNFQEEAKLRFLAYEDAIKKNTKLSEAQKNSAIGTARVDTSKLIDDAFKEKNVSTKEIEEKYNPLFDLFFALKKSRLDALGIGEADGEKKKTELDQIAHYISAYKTLMSGITEFINGESEREKVIEQNKTNALNEELNNRLLNENLSKEARKGIQNEIYQNDEKLRIKQDEIARKKFNTAKAFNLAMAVVDTYGAANKVLNDPALIGRPWARGIMAGATIVSGLAQVAAISRTKFQSTSAATPINTGGGSGGGNGNGDRDFNFNLVGNTQSNQLADAIQSQFSKPLKAFVVSKDVTTQQELDANIKGSATF